jgi:hypothetical protein
VIISRRETSERALGDTTGDVTGQAVTHNLSSGGLESSASSRRQRLD